MDETGPARWQGKSRFYLILPCIRHAGGGVVGLASGIDSCADPSALFGDEILAPLDKFFPLRTATINGLAAAFYVFRDLLFALVDQGADFISGLTGASAQIFRAFLGAVYQVFAGFFTALWRIENADEGTYAQSSQKPCQPERFVFFCHDENSPFAQPRECLSVSKLFGVPQIQEWCLNLVRGAARTSRGHEPFSGTHTALDAVYTHGDAKSRLQKR